MIYFFQVITNASAAVHRSWHILCGGRESPPADEKAVLGELEEQVLLWMGDASYTSEVFHVPFHSASLARGFFVTPGCSEAFPLLDTDVARARELWRRRSKAPQAADEHAQDSKQPQQLFFNLLPPELQVSVHHLVASLHSLLQMADAAEDIFTVGSFSRLVGEQLEAWQPARARRKAVSAAAASGGGGGGGNKVSLVLVDRTLDLAGPTSAAAETVLGRLRASLPAMPGQTSDSAVPMAGLWELPEGQDQVPPGCLRRSSHLRKEGEEDLEELLTEDEDQLRKTYYNKLAKAAGVEENESASLDDLSEIVTRFSKDEEAIFGNLDTLTRAKALLRSRSAQEEKRLGRMSDAADKFAKAWAKSPKEGRGFLVQLSKLVRERRDRGLTLEDLVVLVTHCYSLMPPEEEFYPEDEDRLQSALSEAIVRDFGKGSSSLGQTLSAMTSEAEEVDEIVAYRVVKRLFQKLDSVRKARSVLKGYHSLMEDRSYAGLLRRLLEDIYAEDRREVPDLEHRAGTGLGGLLKSGIGLFGVSVARTHPRENPALWLYVVGGVTADEVRAAKAIVEERSGAEAADRMVVGGTRLLSPREVVQSLFVKDPLLQAGTEED